MRWINLCFALFLLALVTLSYGSIPLAQVMDGAYARLFSQNQDWNALLDERLPRLIVLLCTGASLATAGAVMQTLFNNPLASPSVLGLPSGASLAVLICFISGFYTQYPWSLSLAALEKSYIF